MWINELKNARCMNQNQRYECLNGMNRGGYAAKPRLLCGVWKVVLWQTR